MEIRKLVGEERYAAYLTAVYCFHMRVDDVEAEKEKCIADTKEDWGAFDDDGTLMCRIINNKYNFYLDGKTVSAGGIGGVATLPEYRSTGGVKAIFKELLNEAYKNGEVISTLYPFKHEFYRKQGYEVLTAWHEYTLKPGLLCRYRFDGEVHRQMPGDPIDDIMGIYRSYAPGFNLSHARTEEEMREYLKVDKPYKDRKFAYVLKQDGKPVAYIIFTDVFSEPGAILQVNDLAWTGRDGFNAILGFLARFEADYATIKLCLPKGIDLLRIVESPYAYDIEKAPAQCFMIRVINAKTLLETIRKPDDCDLTIKVTDEIIAENNAVYRVKKDGVERTDESCADIELNVRPLGQLAVGCLTLDEAMLRKDVEVHAKEDMIRRLFVDKNIYVSEHF